MEKYKGFIYFLLICLYVLGSIGGIGYAFYNKTYVKVLGIVADAEDTYDTVLGK